MTLIGYPRVSTDDQNLGLQRTALGEAGCARYEEKVSGASRNRPELTRLLDHRSPSQLWLLRGRSARTSPPPRRRRFLARRPRAADPIALAMVARCAE